MMRIGTESQMSHMHSKSPGIQTKKTVSIYTPPVSARGDGKVQMSKYVEGFQFNLLGVMNTNKDNGIYRIKARIDNLEF